MKRYAPAVDAEVEAPSPALKVACVALESSGTLLAPSSGAIREGFVSDFPKPEAEGAERPPGNCKLEAELPPQLAPQAVGTLLKTVVSLCGEDFDGEGLMIAMRLSAAPCTVPKAANKEYVLQPPV